jgi:TRAP-type C4-dicarboxylate transport system permease small subunit
MLERILRYFTFIFLLALVLLVAYQICLRYVFRNSSVWSEEAACYVFVYLTFLGGCLGLKKDKSLKVTILSDKLPPKLALYIDIVMKALIVVFLITVLWFAFIVMLRLRTQITSALRIPKSVVFFSLLPGISLMVVVTIQQIRGDFKKLVNFSSNRSVTSKEENNKEEIYI